MDPRTRPVSYGAFHFIWRHRVGRHLRELRELREYYANYVNVNGLQYIYNIPPFRHVIYIAQHTALSTTSRCCQPSICRPSTLSHRHLYILYILFISRSTLQTPPDCMHLRERTAAQHMTSHESHESQPTCHLYLYLFAIEVVEGQQYLALTL